jgi:hypothetical protein
MVYIKKLLNICHCQKFQIHLQVLLLLKNTSYNVFKMFLGIFHSLDWLEYIYQYIENNIMWNQFHLEFFILFKNVRYTKLSIGYNCLCTH